MLPRTLKSDLSRVGSSIITVTPLSVREKGGVSFTGRLPAINQCPTHQLKCSAQKTSARHTEEYLRLISGEVAHGRQ